MFSYALLATQVVSSLLFTPYLIRSLGQSEFGLYSLVSAITGYFMLFDAGVGNALVRYVAKFRVAGDLSQQRRSLGLSLLFYGVVGLLVVASGAVFRQHLPDVFGHGLTPRELERAGSLLDITLLNAACILIFSAFDRVIIAYERFVVSKCLSIAQLLTRVTILTGVLFAGYRALAVVTVSLSLTVVFGLVSWWYVVYRIGLRPSIGGVERRFVKDVFGYSSFIFLQMIATQINAMADQVLLGVMTSSVIIGVYAVGAQLSTYFQSVAGSMNGLLMPGVVRMVEQGAGPEVLEAEMVKISRLLLAVLGVILIGFGVAGRPFVELWVGAKNVDAFWVALILMSAMILYLVQAIGSQILWAMGRHKVQAVLNLGVAATNIGLTAFLIRWEPLLGASIGTAVAVLVGNVVVMNIVFSRDIGVSMVSYYRGLFHGILPALVLAGVSGAVASLAGLHGMADLAVRLLAVVVVYCVTMWAFGMNEYEKRLVRPALRALKRSRRVASV